MRDFRDAKVMARSLRESLAARSIQISHSDGLELIAHAFGLRDWNTLSAKINAETPPQPAAPPAPALAGEITAAGSPEALLAALIRTDRTAEVMRACGVDLSRLQAVLEDHLTGEQIADSGPSAADDVKRIIERATFHALASATELSEVHILVALFSAENAAAVHLLHEHGLTRFKVVAHLARHGGTGPNG